MQGIKILIIDDNPDILDLLKSPLQLEGYEVLTAADGEEGFSKFKEFSPHLIVCDIMMPHIDGYEVLRRIREDEKSNIPFIMLSAIGDLDKIKKAYNQEADFYLTKPIDSWVISKNIKTLLSLAQNRRDP